MIEKQKQAVSPEQVQKVKKVRREYIGKVVSDKMDKTIVVTVERTYLHPSLKKVLRANKKYKVHDENKKARVGDLVKIYEGKPQSKTKYMYLIDVLSAANKGLSKMGDKQ